jgi:hypothetical protein
MDHILMSVQSPSTRGTSAITWHKFQLSCDKDKGTYLDGGAASEVSPLAVLVGTGLVSGGLLGESAEDVAVGVRQGVVGGTVCHGARAGEGLEVE